MPYGVDKVEISEKSEALILSLKYTNLILMTSLRKIFFNLNLRLLNLRFHKEEIVFSNISFDSVCPFQFQI